MPRTTRRRLLLLAAAVIALVAAPLAVYAAQSHNFTGAAQRRFATHWSRVVGEDRRRVFGVGLVEVGAGDDHHLDQDATRHAR